MTDGPAATSPAGATLRIFSRSSYPEYLRVSSILRMETVGGALLLAATVLALVLANTPAADAYFGLRDLKIGYEPWHLRLSIGSWAADGLLAIFFFLAGLELKREFVAGDLRSPSRAVVPVAAAIGGVIVPAAVYVAITFSGGPDALRGWAIPTATDIAFAVAVLAVIGSHLPSALRIFLLTLAVVDDLLAIVIIAFFYSADIHAEPLLLAAVPLLLYGFLTHRFARFFAARAWPAWVVLLPIGFAVWALVHASGIHATVAGVLLGFAVPVRAGGYDGGPAAGAADGSVDGAAEAHGAAARPVHTGKHDAANHAGGLAESFEHRFRPVSAGIAVPLFAFFSAGVALGGADGLVTALTDLLAVGIMVALVVGKPAGILLSTWLVTRSTRAALDPELSWVDVTGVAALAGVGFTVSLLISELGFGRGTAQDDHAKIAILAGSLLAALLATVILRSRNRHYRRIEVREKLDANRDGVPDVFEQ